ncbi:MAG: hypothetical protein ACT6FE_04750 [Methanosarcinaceae archaeon]
MAKRFTVGAYFPLRASAISAFFKTIPEDNKKSQHLKALELLIRSYPGLPAKIIISRTIHTLSVDNIWG